MNDELMSAFIGVDSTLLVKRVLQQPKTQMSIHAFSVSSCLGLVLCTL